MGSFTLEPRGPFTLASAARFIAGWPPGQGDVDDDQVSLRFLVDDWSGPAHVILRQDDERRPAARSRPTTRSARSPRRRGSSRSTTTARATRRSASATRSWASCRSAQRLPAPGALPLALRGRGVVDHLRPHAPRAGGEDPRRARRATASSRRPEQLLALRAQLGATGGQAAAPARGRGGRAGGPARPRAAARRRSRTRHSRSSRSCRGSARSTPGLILLRAVGTTDVLAAGRAAAEEGGREALRQAAGAVARGVEAVPDVGVGIDAGARMTLSSTSSATSRPASRRCT